MDLFVELESMAVNAADDRDVEYEPAEEEINNLADIIYIFLLRGRRADQKAEERLFPLQSIK